MTNIFISYNRKSEAITKALVEDFESLGHTVWLDQELSGGQAWWDQILAMVRRCDLFIFVLEPEALNSTACKREYGYAVELGKPILPVLISEGVNINLLPPALSQIQFVDYRKQDRNAAFRLARALSTVPPPKPLPDPLPSPPEVPISYLGSLTAQIETTSTLTYEEQSALVFDLKRSLRDPGAVDDTRVLLEKMRKRRDLFATIAEEIDEVIGSIRKVVTPVGASEITPPPPKQLQRKGTLSILEEHEPPENQESHRSAVQSAQTDTDQKLTWEERVKGACLLALIGVVAGILAVFFYHSIGYAVYSLSEEMTQITWYLFPFGGAIAGAITGMKRTRIVAALVGMSVAVLVLTILNYSAVYGTQGILLALVSSPLGALVGVYIKKREA